MLSRRFSIKRVVELTGLEESEIRYYESVFKEFLTFTQMGMDDNEFNEDHIEILNRIKSLVHKRGFSVVEVKKELKLTLKSFRPKPSTGLPPSKPLGYARVIAVTSGKGGVGKTAIAVNLAVELMGHLEWPAQRLAAERRADLRALVAHAKQGSPFYAKRLAHLNPSTLTEADLASIPPLTKTELMAHWDEVITAPGLTLERCERHLSRAGTDELLIEGYRVVASGGSSGLRAVMAYSDAEWRLFGASIIRWILRWMLRSDEAPSLQLVVAQVQSAVPTHMSGLLARADWVTSLHSFPVTLTP